MKLMKNLKAKIGTGRLIERDAIKLSKYRRCERELVGNSQANLDRGCSEYCRPFEAACYRYHMTDAEKDAAVLARAAYEMGVQRGWVTKRDSAIWRDEQEEIASYPDRKPSPQQQRDEDQLRKVMENFRI